MNPLQADRYRSLLGLGRERPSFEYLAALIRAQLWRVPFENVSKLLYLRRYGLRGIPEVELYLDGIERHGFGGTCYAANHYFRELLAALGFETSLHGADMAAPDVHLVSSVAIGGSRYLVDVGYGAPLFRPWPLRDTAGQAMALGNERYLCSGARDGQWPRLRHVRDGETVHEYSVNPRQREIGEFEAVIRASYQPTATFMRNLVVTRYAPGKGDTIRNLVRIDFEGSVTRRRNLAGTRALVRELERSFGMHASLVEEALDMLREQGADFLT